jgi:hypothetical protein
MRRTATRVSSTGSDCTRCYNQKANRHAEMIKENGTSCYPAITQGVTASMPRGLPEAGSNLVPIVRKLLIRLLIFEAEVIGHP